MELRLDYDRPEEGPGSGPLTVGWFLAQDKGYFKEEGLDVTIDQGEGSAASIPKVAAGAYQAGFGDLNALIDLAAKRPAEAPVGVFMLYNTPPFTIVVKKDSPIRTPKDLEGKTVAVNLGSNFEELLRKNDPNKKIDIRTYDSSFEQDVALGRIDAFVMDRVSTAQLIKESKLPLQQAGAPFETIENALPFLKTPEKQAVLKKVDEALTAMRKDGSLTKISEKWFAADITRK